jgi:hypothetical protein
MPGKWGIAPNTGWTCTDIQDLGAPSATCQMCEIKTIRYVHYMTHPDYPDTLECGCICAGRMEGDEAAAKTREADLKSLSQKRAKWLTRDWRISKAGNEFINTDGFNVVVYPWRGAWATRVMNNNTQEVWKPEITYETANQAKIAAFDAMFDMSKPIPFEPEAKTEAKIMMYDLDTKLGFGKYKGLTVEQILEHDPSYLLWLLENVERFEVDHVLQDTIMKACGK